MVNALAMLFIRVEMGVILKWILIVLNEGSLKQLRECSKG